jgi:glutamate/tyrosine decarboxylase-like PLP-dependent enzyme
LKAYGADKLGAMIGRTCALARYLERRILAEPRLELLAPAQLNIVCFRYRGADADTLNADIVADIHESGIAAPSTTTIDGDLAIRAAIVNHRTDTCDIDALIGAVIAFGTARVDGRIFGLAPSEDDALLPAQPMKATACS